MKRYLHVFAVVLFSAITLLTGGNAGAATTASNIVYEIFVRSFNQDGGPGPVGTLKGVQDKLSYLSDGDPTTHNDLGVGIIWLMPIFPSPSYHGYDVTDYRSVNPDYGTLQDLDDLVTKAHVLGMRVGLTACARCPRIARPLQYLA